MFAPVSGIGVTPLIFHQTTGAHTTTAKYQRALCQPIALRPLKLFRPSNRQLDSTLLLKKSKGLFGEGKWNVPDGKIRRGENPENGVIRETLEETGLRVKNLEQVGLVHFYKNMKRDVPERTGYVFVSGDFSGTLTEGREGSLKWFSVDALPFDEVWEDDRYWSRLVFDPKRFEAWFYYSGEFEKLIDHRIKRIDSGNNSQTIEAGQPR